MSEKNKQPKKPQPVRIVIEFRGPGISDPNLKFDEQVTMGQIRDAALLLYTMAQRHVYDQMTQLQMKQAQNRHAIDSIVQSGKLS